jgi:ribonucleoside-diphosphate reductase beta chain
MPPVPAASGVRGAIHTHAYQYIVESLGLDESEIFNAYNEVKSIRDKDEFLLPFIAQIMDPTFTPERRRTTRSC